MPANMGRHSGLIGLGLIAVLSATAESALSFPQLVPAAPSVTISNGVLVGTRDVMQNQERFLGIPFVQAPTSSNRLRPPQPVTTKFGTLTVTETPQACPQFPLTIGKSFTVVAPGVTPTDQPNPLAFATPQPTVTKHPEDCLGMNIQRPAGVKPSDKLPVVIWFWGGSWEMGSIAAYDPQRWLSKAMSLNSPFIWVGFNYRLGAFGFLAGQQLVAEGATNLGLRDQRAAMEWVKDNIAAFGGDPDNITLFGNSGGGFCVTDHIVINNGDHRYKGKPLFHRVIVDSGLTFPSLENTHPKAQDSFNALATHAGCDSSAADVLDCLRKVDYGTFLEAQNSLRLPNTVISLSYTARPDNTSDFFPISPEESMDKGVFAQIPTITGFQQDEGTFWAVGLDGIDGNNDTQILDLFKPIWPDASQSDLQSYFDTYPKDVEQGCPYETGQVNEFYPGYKRLSAIIGDVVITLSRRRYLDAISSKVKTWSYIGTYFHGTPILGTTHATDVLAIYSGTAPAVPIDQILTRYTAFITKGDPNALNPTGYQPWPQYDTTDRNLLALHDYSTSYDTDKFREASYAVFKRIYPQMRW